MTNLNAKPHYRKHHHLSSSLHRHRKSPSPLASTASAIPLGVAVGHIVTPDECDVDTPNAKTGVFGTADPQELLPSEGATPTRSTLSPDAPGPIPGPSTLPAPVTVSDVSSTPTLPIVLQCARATPSHTNGSAHAVDHSGSSAAGTAPGLSIEAQSPNILPSGYATQSRHHRHQGSHSRTARSPSRSASWIDPEATNETAPAGPGTGIFHRGISLQPAMPMSPGQQQYISAGSSRLFMRRRSGAPSLTSAAASGASGGPLIAVCSKRSGSGWTWRA